MLSPPTASYQKQSLCLQIQSRLFPSPSHKTMPPFSIFSILTSLLRLLFFSSLLSSSVLSITTSKAALSSRKQCVHDHFSALLHLKHGFRFSSDVYYPFNSTTTLSSWNPNNTDCCSWEGITCHEATTSHVVGLDLSSRDIFGQVDFGSLFRIRSLRRLNLAYNSFHPSPTPSGFDQLMSLTHLSLSHSSSFYGQIPLEISRLTSLVSLDLSSSYYDSPRDLKLQNPNLRVLVQNLSSLRELHLDYVNIGMDGSKWGQILSLALPRLRKLSLSGCRLSGPIPSSLSQLHFLSDLDLSGNDLLTGVVPDFLGNLSSLRSLCLGGYGLHGEFPPSIFRLPNLQTLDISGTPDLTGYFPEFPQNNTLQYLDLSNTGLSGELPDSAGNLRLLTDLDLSGCNLSGSLPSSLGNLTKLQHLDLSQNRFNGSIPSSLFSLPSLQRLDLSWNQFCCRLSEFGNTSSSQLEVIDLSDNDFQGPIPRSISKLTKLIELDLSWNNFSGAVNLGLFKNLTYLLLLDLSQNNLSSYIDRGNNSTFIWGDIPSLRALALSNNQFSGKLGELHNGSNSLLESIHLDNNNFQGPIPRSFFELTQLRHLHLSSNNFSSFSDLGLFQNLKQLSYLDLSDNKNFTITDGGSNSTSSSFSPITYLNLRSCNITKFPGILKNQVQMVELDLSNNRINGEIPQWIWKVGNGTLALLNLSHNALEGLEGPFPHLYLTSLQYLDLSYNRLKGFISLPSASTIIFSISSNNFNGEVPSLVCNATNLEYLDLSNNQFSGQIPPCLGGISESLIVLDLGGNNFDGPLLQTFRQGCSLETLHLNGNRLKGRLPRSLANCTQLEVLDLGNNQINNTFPSWLEHALQLRILILRSNQFHGNIGHTLSNEAFPLLKIFDISSNSFSGHLPYDMFASWKAMTRNENSISQNATYDYYYRETMVVVLKGQELSFVKILPAFSLMDFSNNKFHGNIPKSMGDLQSLHSLNMSYNSFMGGIPTSFKNLRNLESLDLSHNNLSGEIPWQLTELTFLEVLDLSQNFLVGSIPQGRQFPTFTNKSFQGNPGLCGPPLSRQCRGMNASLPSTQSEKAEGEYDWGSIWIGSGVGYGVGVGIFFWTLTLWRKARREFYIFTDKILSMIFPSAQCF